MNLALQFVCSDKFISKKNFGEKSYSLNNEGGGWFPTCIFKEKKI